MAVQRALSAGQLERQTCEVCDIETVDAHHDRDDDERNRSIVAVSIWLLVLDNESRIQCPGAGGTPLTILQLLRYLSNEIKACLVCLGVSEARDAISGDTQLARRLDQFVLPRWKADEEFHEFVTAILRSLPLKLPSVVSSQSLRHLSRLGDSITARVFGILNELATEAIQQGTERITDELIESWRPAMEKEAAFA